MGKKRSCIAMTTNEFNKKLEEKIQLIEKENKPLLLAVKSVTALQSKRIFLDSQNVSNAPIGDYKNREYYVNPKNSPKKFPTKGKSGETKFKNGQAHRTGYFTNWLALKKTIGRNQRVNTVDLFYTGALSRNWANAEILSKASAIRVNQHNYIVSLTEANKAKVSRYGNVFGLSKNEKDVFLKTVQFELKKSLQ